ncbi:MAG: endopeptidase La [Planctomycetes bacterium]|nr:endopeptidase La [Planctomycetota bacterium]
MSSVDDAPPPENGKPEKGKPEKGQRGRRKSAAGIQAESREATAPALTLGERLPTTLFVFPLRRSVPFPNLMMPVLLESADSRAIAQKAEAGNGHVFLLTQLDAEQEKPKPGEFHAIGVIARILKILQLPDGTSSLMVQGRARARVQRFVRQQPQLVAKVAEVVDIPTPGKRTEATFRKLRDGLRRIAEANEQFGEEFATAVINLDTPAQLADFTGAYFLKDTADRQAILETLEVGPRVEKALGFVLAELELVELGKRIEAEIRQKTEKAQKDWFLREQLKILRRELGEQVDAREAELMRLEKAVADAGLPDKALERANDELQKLRTTPVESAEYGVVRNYLDWLTALPWSRSSADNEDLEAAAKVLDEDHYGLVEVKDRILEFLAVRKLQPRHAGSILCLAGPPGVGKTSLGRSIARAMGRSFWRFSLGGMRDEAEIKGHRRTYVGAMPGRILQGMKSCGTSNPVIVLDEVDKLGQDFRGDPSSALLEVLDPEQNHAFLDHYLDVPFDLSKVMFIATANALPQIPEPLRDRMDVVEIPGYLLDEKVEIARRHVLPKQRERHGLKPRELELAAPVLRRLIPAYTREAGVRGLEKMVQKLCRKSATLLGRGKPPVGRLTWDAVPALLGPERFNDEDDRKELVEGVVKGLAWTPHGGDVLFIEAAVVPGGSGLTLTGSLGDVMSESVKIALSFVRSHAAEFGLDAAAFDKCGFHVHFPAGAIQKDGPSAGIAITTALVSLLTQRRVPQDLAMTGELTLVGEVLPIGGVREKVLAAKRFGIRRVILPAENRRDVLELKTSLVTGLRFVYVETFADVSAAVFGKAARGRRSAR